jgi:hypothetical protein
MKTGFTIEQYMVREKLRIYSAFAVGSPMIGFLDIENVKVLTPIF